MLPCLNPLQPMLSSTRVLLVALALAAASALFAVGTAPTAAEPEDNFGARYHGTFSLTFAAVAAGSGSCPSGGQPCNSLLFAGHGIAGDLGLSSITGSSLLQPVSQACSVIVADKVTLTAANGDILALRNSGQDCFNPTTQPPTILGSGTYTVTGGSGRLDGASGTGSFSVSAQVATISATSASGTFDPIAFDGSSLRIASR